VKKVVDRSSNTVYNYYIELTNTVFEVVAEIQQNVKKFRKLLTDPKIPFIIVY
jgi:hypothetical protein